MVFLFVFADSFIDILFSNKYEMSVVPFRVYLLMLPIRIVYYGSAFIALGKTKEIMYRSIVSLVLTGMLAYLLTMWFGYVGAAVAAVVISYFWAIPYNLITLSKAFSCSAFYVIPLSNVARIIFISLLAMIPVSMLLLFSLDHIISFTLGLFIYALLYSIMANRYVPEFADVSAQFKYKLTKLIIKFK
jgi:O-antigen/teichoic acid export membrane protein